KGAVVNFESLWFLCVLLFVDGATFAFATTALLIQYAKYDPPWAVALAGGAASALGSAVQLLLLRWLLGAKQPWMRRFAPSRGKLEAALKTHPSASFLAIMLARATPLPDAPLKLVAAAVRYPIPRYFFAIFLGALPYYYALALIGEKFRFPGWILVTAVAAILLGVVLDHLWRRRRSAA
ncbi:MAG: VTT domain-containing protein, partial [Candidatus Eisenbacteria bacterium]|nr:VTT domain-containing protein [Candidatus Eisenbacteria bacterium]